MPVADVTAHARGGEGEQRAQALAAGIDEVPGEVGDKGDGAAQPVVDDAIGRGHILRHQRMQAVHGGQRSIRYL